MIIKEDYITCENYILFKKDRNIVDVITLKNRIKLSSTYKKLNYRLKDLKNLICDISIQFTEAMEIMNW